MVVDCFLFRPVQLEMGGETILLSQVKAASHEVEGQNV